MGTTFTLTITGTEHGEWQGKLKDATQSEKKFESILELVRLVDHEAAGPLIWNNKSSAER